jgi:outer membrane protein insertion porin family
VRVPAIVLCLVAAAVARAQQDPFGGGASPQAGGGPPPEPAYVRPKEALEPLPAPLTAQEEAARERAREKGVLVSGSPQPGHISEVRVVGARKVEADAVLVQIQSRIDRKPDRKMLQADVRRIWAMDIFQDVVVEARPGPNDSIRLTFRLTEKPAIDEVLYEGNRDVSAEDLGEVVDLKAFQVLDVARIKANVQKLQKLYVDKGYFLADVTYEVRPSTGTAARPSDKGLLDYLDDDSRSTAGPQSPIAVRPDGDRATVARPDQQEAGQFVDVVFKIVEAAKVKVEKITFVGNEKLSADDLLPILRTREAHPLGIVTEWGTYKVEGSEIDTLAIEALYQDRGFINVKVGKPHVELSQDKTRISLAFPVTEGKQFRLRSLDVAGDLVVQDVPKDRPADAPPLFARRALLERARLKSGELFSRSQIATDIQAIADRYRDAGYAFVNIEPGIIPHDDDDTLELTVNIQSGPRVKIERIEITGNTKTQDAVIRRELRAYEGEWYSASLLRLSEQRVNALGFFEKVNVTTKQGSQPDRMTLVFDVKEKSTGTFQIGAGFSNAESIIFNGQISYNNFFGLGTTVSGSAQLSSFRRIFDFRYIDPYFVEDIAGQPLTLSLSAFNTSRFFLDFTRNSTGGDLTFGYPVGTFVGAATGWKDSLKAARSDATPQLFPYIPDFDNLQLFLAGSLERVEIDESNFTVRLLGLQTNLPRWTTSVRLSSMFDMRNNRLFPSAGWFLQGSVELASPMLGSVVLPGAEAAAKSAAKSAGITDLPLCPGLGCLKSTGLANNFVRYSGTARGYLNGGFLLPELSSVVLKANVEVGLLQTENQLIFENFYLGGFNTIRGYFLRSISPVARVGSSTDPSAPLVEFRTGGNKQFIANLELEFPIFEQVGIRGVFFFDAGNAYGADENFFYVGNGPSAFLQTQRCGGVACWDPHTELPLGLFYSLGAGVRWLSPLGPLRFEWGVPLTPRPAGSFGFAQGDQPFQFEFNVGNSF